MCDEVLDLNGYLEKPSPRAWQVRHDVLRFG